MVRRVRHPNSFFPFARCRATVKTLSDCARGFHLDSFDTCWMKTITRARMDGGQRMFNVLGRMDGCSKLSLIILKRWKFINFGFPMLKSSYDSQLVMLPWVYVPHPTKLLSCLDSRTRIKPIPPSTRRQSESLTIPIHRRSSISSIDW